MRIRSDFLLRRKSKHTDEKKPTAPQIKRAEHRKKYDIIGILMLVGAMLLFLALISYSHADETSADISFGQFLKIFAGDPEIKARADVTTNWLGLFGAIVALFFIHSTIGYFSLVFPILLGWWGWIILRERDMRVSAYYTNYIVLIAFLGSTLLGLLRLVSWLPHPGAEWSGDIGDFTAGILASLIGTVGGTVAILTTILILAVIVIDYDIHKTFERLQSIFEWMKSRAGERLKKSEEHDAIDASETQTLEEELLELERMPVEKKPKRPLTKPSKEVRINKPEKESARKTTAKEPEEEKIQTTFSISRKEETPVERDSPIIGVQEQLPLRSDGVIPMSELMNPDYHPEEKSGEKSTIEVPKPTKEETTPRVVISTKKGLEEIPLYEKEEVLREVEEVLSEPAKSLNPDEVNQTIARESPKYIPPPVDILNIPIEIDVISDEELKAKAELVKDKLAMFDITINNISVTPGPVVTLYELVPDSGVKISKIVALADDLALALAAKGIRIIAPIPGKSAVGIEIPNDKASLVNIRSIVSTPKFRDSKQLLTLGMGKTITGDVFCDDLAKMPHLLVAGSTGSGKSVGINVMLMSLLYKMNPADVKFVLIDPKKIELAQYKPLRKHFLAVCPDINEEIITTPVNSVIALKSLELEMEQRYERLAKAGVRHINDYNAKVKSHSLKDSETMKHYKLPFIVVVIDELADLMITAAREVEEPIARLAQLARAVGIHLVLATQRPSVDVITGVIKANFSSRIAYQVASRIDSRTILDMNGAEQLLGNGDMLYQPSGSPKPIRIQNAFISTEEVERVVEHIAAQKGYSQPYRLPSVAAKKRAASGMESDSRDELFEEAARLIVRHQQGSVSLLQRRLKIGYSRAARIVDELEMAGIVGPYDGSKAREVMVESEAELDQLL